MLEPDHPGDTILGCDSDEDSLSCELDEAKPGKILVSIEDEGEFAGGIYVDPEDAREFAKALIYYADHANYWVEVDE